MQQDIPSNSENTAGLVSQPGLTLPTPSMQNQIHELSKTLPAPRKQNTACDACRSRKVKCHRLPGQDRCQHCLSKNYPCTHYVQQATSEKKRGSAVARRPRHLSNPSSTAPGPSKIASPTLEIASSPTSSIPPTSHSITLPLTHGFYPRITLNTPTREVLSYVFAPPQGTNDRTTPFGHMKVNPSYTDWGELAVKLEDDNFKAESMPLLIPPLPPMTISLMMLMPFLLGNRFALDLVEVFFQIVHTRLPLLNPTQFRNRLQIQTSVVANKVEKPLHPALVATVLAWGTKFSEHPLLVADRKRPGGQSLLAKTLIDRARELAEAMKVHRIPTADHLVIALLIEPLQSQNPDDPNGFHGFWLTSATRHLLDLQINHKSVMANIPDPDARGTMIFAWWMACIADAYHSAYYRRKPVLDDDDYDIDFYTVDPIDPDITEPPMPSPREQLEFLGYYRAAHALARISRQMARQLWRPTTDSDGIPFEVLCTLTTALSEWREEFLSIVGVPSNFEGEWDFVSAVSSCASDATYHVMWIILFSALDDFGVKEVNEVTRMGNSVTSVPNYSQIDVVKRKVADEALHGALRIAGLAGVLTSNGYLRLDPAVMHVSCIQAGTLLARLGRPEVSNCIAGLEQYSYSYEEAGDQAIEMKRVYTAVRAGELELNHMASVALRVTDSITANHAMVVDEAPNGSDSTSPLRKPHAFSSGNAFSRTLYG